MSRHELIITTAKELTLEAMRNNLIVAGHARAIDDLCEHFAQILKVVIDSYSAIDQSRTE